MRKQWTSWQQLRDQSVEDRMSRPGRNRLKALTENQGIYLSALEKASVTICVGPAGTGKTHMACGKAAELLRDGKVKKIIITRPLVTCGKGMGFLPGDLSEKVTPYMRPLLDAFESFFSKVELDKYIHQCIIELWPLDMMRDSSIKDAVIICDEAQNAEFSQLYMLLTRPDRGSRLVIAGDDTSRQTDLSHMGLNPLREVILRFEKKCHPQIHIIRLGRQDIVRSGIIQWIDERLSAPLEEAQNPIREAVECGQTPAPVKNEPEPEGEDSEGENWHELDCPECGTSLWVDDQEGDVEQCECHRCMVCIDLWNEKDEFEPRVASQRIEGCVWTLHRKP